MRPLHYVRCAHSRTCTSALHVFSCHARRRILGAERAHAQAWYAFLRLGEMGEESCKCTHGPQPQLYTTDTRTSSILYVRTALSPCLFWFVLMLPCCSTKLPQITVVDGECLITPLIIPEEQHHHRDLPPQAGQNVSTDRGLQQQAYEFCHFHDCRAVSATSTHSLSTASRPIIPNLNPKAHTPTHFETRTWW